MLEGEDSNEEIWCVVIDGNDVNQLVPLNSTWNLTIKVDASEMMTFEAYFPSFDLSISKTIDTSKKLSLEDARRAIVDYFGDTIERITLLEAITDNSVVVLNDIAETNIRKEPMNGF